MIVATKRDQTVGQAGAWGNSRQGNNTATRSSRTYSWGKAVFGKGLPRLRAPLEVSKSTGCRDGQAANLPHLIRRRG